MSVGSSEGEAMCEMNTTPLIDVMLVLLVTLILSLPTQTHAVKLDMPPPPVTPPPPPPVPPEIIDLDVDFDGTIAWNGRVMTIQELDQQFKPESRKDPQPEIHFRPDRRARYDVVAKVLATAQRNRMTKIGFTNTADFAND
jgi:biopolymer transport protein ExbD